MSLPTLAEFRTYLGMDADSTLDTALLQFALDATSEAIAQDLNRITLQPDTAVSDRDYIPTDPPWVCEVDEFSSLSGLVVKSDMSLDGLFATTISSTSYVVEPVNAVAYGLPFQRIRLLGLSWPISPYGRPSVRITAKWGFPVLPDAIKMACLLQASRWYQRKNSPEGVLGSNDFGTVRVTRTDPDVFAMVRPYKRYALG